tara:strand:+ start:54 stop:4262 length:4209 start_codon:yes stop_codon:yes gene_type:complete
MGITGKQIRDESVTEDDIKDGSIKAAELSTEAISGHEELESVDPAADKLLILDTSGTPTLKWAFPNNLGIAGGSSSLTIVGQQTDTTPISITNTTQITFDWDTGIYIDPDGANQVKVKLGSHFNPITVDGQSSVEASGESSLEFIDGSNMSITTDNTAKSITFNALPGNEMQLGANPLDRFTIKKSTGAELFEFFDSGDVLFGEATQFILRSTNNSPKIIFQTQNPGVARGFIGSDHQDSNNLKIGAGPGFSNPAITINSSGEITRLGQDTPTDGQVLTWDNTNTKVIWADAPSGGGSGSDTFKTISVSGQQDIIADSTTDTLTIVAGTNVTITTNDTADSITINAIDTDTTYTVGDGGLTQKNFTDALKTKLDGIEEGAQVNVTPDWTAEEGQPGYIDGKPGDFSNNSQGLVPSPEGSNTLNQFLREDGSWQEPDYRTDEEIQDIVGVMVDGGTETNITVWYDDTAGKLNFAATDTTYSVGDGGLTQNNFTDDLKNKLDGIDAAANDYSHPSGSGNEHIPSGGSSGQFLKWSANGSAEWANDNDTTYSSFVGDSGSGGTQGLVPAPGTGDAAANKFLNADGTWASPPSAIVSAINSAVENRLTTIGATTSELTAEENLVFDSSRLTITGNLSVLGLPPTIVTENPTSSDPGTVTSLGAYDTTKWYYINGYDQSANQHPWTPGDVIDGISAPIYTFHGGTGSGAERCLTTKNLHTESGELTILVMKDHGSPAGKILKSNHQGLGINEEIYMVENSADPGDPDSDILVGFTTDAWQDRDTILNTWQIVDGFNISNINGNTWTSKVINFDRSQIGADYRIGIFQRLNNVAADEAYWALGQVKWKHGSPDRTGYINFEDDQSHTEGEPGYGIRSNDGTMEFKNEGGSWEALSGGAADADWTLNGSDAYRDGDVGIGNTNPISKLDVSGKIAITAEQSSTPAAPANGKGWLYTKTDGKLYWQSGDLSETDLTAAAASANATWESSGNYIRLLDSSKNVGIGDSSPSAKLEIRSSNNAHYDVGNRSNYHLFLQATGADDGEGPGIGFSQAGDDDDVGAGILFERTGSESKGELQFYIKQSTTTAANPVRTMQLTENNILGVGYHQNSNTSTDPGGAYTSVKYPPDPNIFGSNAQVGKICIHSHEPWPDGIQAGPALHFSRWLGYNGHEQNNPEYSNLGEIWFHGSRHGGDDYDGGAAIIAETSAKWGTDQQPTRMKFQINPIDSGDYTTALILGGGPNHWAAHFKNDGNNKNRKGIKIQCGEDSPSSAGDIVWMDFYDGNGTAKSFAEYTSTGDHIRFTGASDKRIKTDIANTKINAIEIFKQIEMKEFKIIRNNITGPLDPIGFIAQNIEPLIPSMVSEHSVEDYEFDVKHLGSTGLIPYLAKAIQELIEKNEQLESRILELENKL